MDIGSKLQLKAGQKVAFIAPPTGVSIDLPEGAREVSDPEQADAVILFVLNEQLLDELSSPAVSAALDDRLTWVAYPKARQLGTDLSRDLLVAHLSSRGIQPVRQIAIDDTWSALRFRPDSSV